MTHWPNPAFGLFHIGWLRQKCVSLALAFCSDEVNLSVRSMYALFTSLHTGWFNRVWWLHASHDLTADLAAVCKLVVGCYLRNLGKGLWIIKGVMRNKKIIRVFFSSFSISRSLILTLSLSQSLTLSLSLSLLLIYTSIYLSLSLSLLRALSL